VILGTVYRTDPYHELKKRTNGQLQWHDGTEDIGDFYDTGLLGYTDNLSAAILSGNTFARRTGNRITIRRIELRGFVQASVETVHTTCRFLLVQRYSSDTALTPLLYEQVIKWEKPTEPKGSSGNVDGLRQISMADNSRLLWDSGPIAVIGSTSDANSSIAAGVTESLTEQEPWFTQHYAPSPLTFNTSSGLGVYAGTAVTSVPAVL